MEKINKSITFVKSKLGLGPKKSFLERMQVKHQKAEKTRAKAYRTSNKARNVRIAKRALYRAQKNIELVSQNIESLSGSPPTPPKDIDKNFGNLLLDLRILRHFGSETDGKVNTQKSLAIEWMLTMLDKGGDRLDPILKLELLVELKPLLESIKTNSEKLSNKLASINNELKEFKDSFAKLLKDAGNDKAKTLRIMATAAKLGIDVNDIVQKVKNSKNPLMQNMEHLPEAAHLSTSESSPTKSTLRPDNSRASNPTATIPPDISTKTTLPSETPFDSESATTKTESPYTSSMHDGKTKAAEEGPEENEIFLEGKTFADIENIILGQLNKCASKTSINKEDIDKLSEFIKSISVAVEGLPYITGKEKNYTVITNALTQIEKKATDKSYTSSINGELSNILNNMRSKAKAEDISFS